jgi:hypothetical protein
VLVLDADTTPLLTVRTDSRPSISYTAAIRTFGARRSSHPVK